MRIMNKVAKLGGCAGIMIFSMSIRASAGGLDVQITGGNVDFGRYYQNQSTGTSGNKWGLLGSADGTESIYGKVTADNSWIASTDGNNGADIFVLRAGNSTGTIISGTDVSLITYGGSLPKVLQAAERLAEQGVQADVIDLRVLRPLDTETILASVARTHRAVIVDEGWRTGSLAAEISAQIMEGAFFELDAPVARVCSADVPIPYASHMEDAALPRVETIVQTAQEMVARHG